METKSEHRSRVVSAQIDYCDAKNYPFFMPKDGICWRCGRDITTEISEDLAGSILITACPFCHMSYCD